MAGRLRAIPQRAPESDEGVSHPANPFVLLVGPPRVELGTNGL